tara:strand:- start:2621 stop:2830 length:210 start_codon:yes stop_codon:yes gene_type:complete
MKGLIQHLNREKFNKMAPPVIYPDAISYQESAAARISNNPEPDCPYAPGSPEYTHFAEGFCNAKPISIP